VGNLWIALGKYGIRHYQVTDVKEKYAFEEYLHMRYYSCFFMVAASLVYVGAGLGSGYSWYKAGCVLLACGIKLIDAFEDVLHGRLQQKEKLYVAGKVLSLRLFLYILLFVVLYAVSRNLLLTFFIAAVVSLFLAVYLNGLVSEQLERRPGWKPDRKKVRGLLVECLPLCASFFLNTYLFNAPKYLIDQQVSDQVQSCFNVVFMPVFVISLLSTFIFQPMLHKSAILWEEKKYKEFNRILLRQTGIILLLTLLADGGGWLIGVPVLGAIFSVDLTEYKVLLLLLITSGGISAYINFMHMILTTLRKQKLLLASYGVTAAAMLLVGSFIMRTYGLMAMSWAFLVLLLALSVALTLEYGAANLRKKTE
jgi:O-antigen/teichoic acid export membrane protein